MKSIFMPVLWAVVILPTAMITASFAASLDAPPAPGVLALEKTVKEAQDAWAIGGHADQIDHAYPQLRNAAADFFANPPVISSTIPSDPGAKATIEKPVLEGVVLDSVNPQLVRFLNFWHRADLTQRNDGQFPLGTFDKIVSTIPVNSAFVLAKQGDEHLIYWFNQEKAGAPWQNFSRTDLSAALRLGSALALIQDNLERVRDKHENTLPSDNPEVKWDWGTPAMWIFLEQYWNDKSMGFFPLQERLGSLRKQDAMFGLWVRENGNSNLGVQIYLTTTTSTDKYLGWRFAKLVKTDQPLPEGAK